MPKYLYNGIGLPALPRVDNTFPCATILPIYKMVGLNYVFDRYGVWFTTTDVFHINSAGNLSIKDRNADLRSICYKCDDDVWVGDGSVITLSIAFTADGVTWTNYDLLNADGSVYLAATVPVIVGGEIDGTYSYNGMTLPHLPNGYDDYPYRAILGHTDEYAAMYPGSMAADRCLYLSKKPFTVGTISSRLYLQDLIDCPSFVCSYGEKTWEFKGNMTFNEQIVEGANRVLWSNHVIKYTDGTLYLAASEPVLVTEPEPATPSASNIIVFNQPLFSQNPTIVGRKEKK